MCATHDTIFWYRTFFRRGISNGPFVTFGCSQKYQAAYMLMYWKGKESAVALLFLLPGKPPQVNFWSLMFTLRGVHTEILWKRNRHQLRHYQGTLRLAWQASFWGQEMKVWPPNCSNTPIVRIDKEFSILAYPGFIWPCLLLSLFSKKCHQFFISFNQKSEM